MNDVEGYDVLRLIDHNQRCYVSTDYVEGKPLVMWLKYHPNLTKEQLFLWIQEMARQLECIHRCQGNPCYQYVNPYSIIVTEEKQLYFLDMNTESNEKMIVRMNRRCIRENFLPPEANYYQTASVALDIYGLGKTIQYFISMVQPTPPLTRHEEAKLQKIISKSLNGHSKRTYKSVFELRKEIPKSIEKEQSGKKKIWKTVILAIVAAGILLYMYQSKAAESEGVLPAVKEQEEEVQPVVEDSRASEENLLRYELGFIYFLDLKEYEKSREYFADIENDETAGNMAALARYLEGGRIEKKKLREILEDIEESMSVENQENYYRCLIRGYGLLDTEEDAEQILRIGALVMKGNPEEDAERECTRYMASAYEKTNQQEEAIKLYTDMLDWEKDEKAREEVYRKLTVLWEEKEESGQALQICRQGIEELEDSAELKLIYIRMQCADAGIDRAVCAQTIQECLHQMPELAEEQEFQKLVREYGIVIEGENVWVGR